MIICKCRTECRSKDLECAALTDAKTGRIALYYGCADTVTGLAFTTVDDLMDYMKKYTL